ncbi:MAG: nitroreductase family protein [Candidatus Thorarchaeota archaeon]|jgi:nitroreductase
MIENCLDAVKSRCSIRKFESTDISEENVNDILEVGFSAPSAGNRQPWRVVVVRNKNTKVALAEAAHNQKFLAPAPVVLVVCAVPEESAERYGKRGKTLYVLQDTAALTQNLLLAAHMKGYGACWIGAFDEALVVKAIDVPDGMRPVAIIPIGLIAGPLPEKRHRRPLAEVVVSERF